jgi:hypothetical protein
MSDNQNSNRPTFPKTILDNRSLKMYTEAADQGKTATLFWDVNDVGEALIKVWPQDSEDSARNRGPIEAKLTLPLFNHFCELMRMAIRMSQENKGKEWKDKVENVDRPWVRGDGGKNERSKDYKPVSAVWVGCSEDGKVWIALDVYRRPKIQFFFGKTVYNNLYHGDGQPYTDAEVSRAFARGNLKVLEDNIPRLIVERYDHQKTLPKPKGDNQRSGGNNGGGNYGGGNNYNRGGNGGGSSGGGNRSESSHSNNESSSSDSSSDYDLVDDDLPF